MTITKTSYFGFGVIFAPKTEEHNGHLIINLLIWEISFAWGKNG